MSIFTNDEMVIIRRLKDGPRGRDFIANVIDSEMPNSRIKINKRTRKAHILIENDNNPQTTHELTRINNVKSRVEYLISISFALVDYLVSCGYASIRLVDNDAEEVTIGGGRWNDAAPHAFEITNPATVDLLIKYNESLVIIPDETLNI